MGCDIHLYVEVKIDGEWYTYNHPNIKRNYDLFAKMADVRNCDEERIEPIVEPRGFPDDSSLICRLDYESWGCDAHSVSYLNQQEIELLDKWCSEQPWVAEKYDGGVFWFGREFGWLFGNSIGDFTRYRDDYPDFLQDVRLVFWFDN